MPGVNTTFATRSGPVNADAGRDSRFFITGQFERGPVGEAVRVRSLAETEVLFGGRVAYGSAYDALRCFFEEGGTDAFVSRVVGAGATNGFVILQDRRVAPGPTLRIEARNPGAWSSALQVAVLAGSEVGTFALSVWGAIPGDQKVYDNLTSPADAVAALARSPYVKAIDLGSAGTLGANLPALIAGVALSAGNDQRAAITAVSMTDALEVFGPELGAGVVAVPGYSSFFVGDAALAHAVEFSRIYLGACDQGSTADDEKEAAAALVSLNGKHGAIIAPWVEVPVGSGFSKLISPEAYAAAARARVVRSNGVWQSPAGDVSEARFVLGPERVISRVEGDDLNENHVSAIRVIAGTTRLYGWRSLSADVENYRLLNAQDTLNVVKYRAEDVLERYIDKSIDAAGRLLASIKASLIGILEPIRVKGGLYELIVDGKTVDPGYSVDVGATVNTLALLQSDRLAAVIALRVSPTSEQINLTIVKAALTATV